jgi:RND superfamily putative drug exporter
MKATRNIAARAGAWSAQHRAKAILGWLALVLVAVFIGGSIGTQTIADEDLGVGESKQADQAIARAFPDNADETVLVQTGASGPTAGQPEFRAVVQATVRRLASTENVIDISSPYFAGSEGAISQDGHSALITFEVPDPGDASEVTTEDLVASPLEAVADLDAAYADFRIEEFGDASANKQVNEAIEADFRKAEVTSLPITLVILLLAFGALVAALVPLLLATTAVAAAIGLLGPLSQIWPLDQSVNSVVLLVGLAVGVDYSMFYLRREREERARGNDTQASLQAAAATSGRAVMVSGITVAIAMAGMFLAGASTFTSFAAGTILVVAIAVGGSLTVLPAVLSKLGDRINKGRVPLVTRPEERVARQSRIWSAILDRVLAHPVVATIGATGVLLVLASPAMNLRLTVPSFEQLPPDLQVVRTYDRIQAAFPGNQIPAQIAVERHDASNVALTIGVHNLRQRVEASNSVVPPITVQFSPDRSLALVDVPVVGDGLDNASNAALAELRDQIIPATVGRVPGLEANVTGYTASSEDFNNLMESRVPVVFAFVLGLAFVLLLATFRSIVIPIKAILLNLLSVSATYGVVVWIFQEGHFESLLGFKATGAVVSWLPLFLFVLLFGLSMDYHVFILSRVREAYDSGLSTKGAVSRGVKSTASVVTAAAAVMIAVFAIFATLSSVIFKEFGVGLAVAVLIDATIIRGVLLPATMTLLGDWNWYLPRSLGWLPKIGIGEGTVRGPGPKPTGA